MPTVKSTDETFEKMIKDNKVVVTDFWASWCKPCVNEIPSLNNLNENFSSNDDFQVVAINIGQNKDIVENFLKCRKFSTILEIFF